MKRSLGDAATVLITFVCFVLYGYGYFVETQRHKNCRKTFCIVFMFGDSGPLAIFQRGMCVCVTHTW